MIDLVEIKAPEVILRNEKRMLQESVDSLEEYKKAKSASGFKKIACIEYAKNGNLYCEEIGEDSDF